MLGQRATVLAAVTALAAAAAASLPSFLLASDMSYLPALDCEGTCSPFRASASGPVQDALAILASSGVNAIRVRLWVDPPGSTLQDTYANLTHVARYALRIKAAGLAFWLDLHYSDTWSDPSHQFKPAAWANLSFPELTATVHNWTRDSLALLAAQGTPPAIVAVGNEIDNGMLWAEAYQSCEQGARLWVGCDGDWERFGALLGAGQAGVRAALGQSAAIMLHSYRGSKLGQLPWGPTDIIQFLANATEYGGGDYDMAGFSFYPHWGAGGTQNLTHLAAVHAAFPALPLVIAETAYPWQGTADPGSQFPWTPAGQLAYLQAAVSTLRGVAGAAGVAWWGGEYYADGSGAGQTALFDHSAVALPALLQGFKP